MYVRFSEYRNATEIIALDPNDGYAAVEYAAILEALGYAKVKIPIVQRPLIFSNPSPANNITYALLKKHAILSKISYCHLNQLKSWSCSLCKTSGVELVSTFQSTGGEMQGYVAVDHSEKSIVTSFRGSSNIENWLTNILIVKTNLNGAPTNAHAHLGFILEWNRDGVKTEVALILSNLVNQYPSYKLTFVGHSLGGAVATIAALDLAAILKIDFSRMRLMTQGMPRIGDDNLAMYISSLNWNFLDRVVNHRDIVAHAPPRILNFMHYDKVHWIDGVGQLFKCNINPGSEENDCANTFDILHPWDHILDQYFNIYMLQDNSC